MKKCSEGATNNYKKVSAPLHTAQLSFAEALSLIFTSTL